jgi:hypothetical protein
MKYTKGSALGILFFERGYGHHAQDAGKRTQVL